MTPEQNGVYLHHKGPYLRTPACAGAAAAAETQGGRSLLEESPRSILISHMQCWRLQ